jgi:hypothetical protein
MSYTRETGPTFFSKVSNFLYLYFFIPDNLVVWREVQWPQKKKEAPKMTKFCMIIYITLRMVSDGNGSFFFLGLKLPNRWSFNLKDIWNCINKCKTSSAGFYFLLLTCFQEYIGSDLFLEWSESDFTREYEYYTILKNVISAIRYFLISVDLKN